MVLHLFKKEKIAMEMIEIPFTGELKKEQFESDIRTTFPSLAMTKIRYATTESGEQIVRLKTETIGAGQIAEVLKRYVSAPSAPPVEEYKIPEEIEGLCKAMKFFIAPDIAKMGARISKVQESCMSAVYTQSETLRGIILAAQNEIEAMKKSIQVVQSELLIEEVGKIQENQEKVENEGVKASTRLDSMQVQLDRVKRVFDALSASIKDNLAALEGDK